MVDKMIEKVVELMKQQDKIRNIGIVAHIDHGKCVSANTRILLDEGSIITAEQLHNLAEKKGKKVFEDKNKVIYDT